MSLLHDKVSFGCVQDHKQKKIKLKKWIEEIFQILNISYQNERWINSNTVERQNMVIKIWDELSLNFNGIMGGILVSVYSLFRVNVFISKLVFND